MDLAKRPTDPMASTFWSVGQLVNYIKHCTADISRLTPELSPILPYRRAFLEKGVNALHHILGPRKIPNIEFMRAIQRLFEMPSRTFSQRPLRESQDRRTFQQQLFDVFIHSSGKAS